MFARLPREVRATARAKFTLFVQNPHHPSLHFKPLRGKEDVWSVRISQGYRAVAKRQGDRLTWFWIGTHNDYDSLLGS